MANKWGESSRCALSTCDPKLQRLFNRVLKHYDCTVLEGHRGEERQDRMFDTGRSHLKWPNGNHNTFLSKAVDVVPYPVDWKDLPRMARFAGFVQGLAVAMDIDLIWGGDWDRDGDIKEHQLQDYPHFEIVTDSI